MTTLIIGLILFLGVHSARIFADGWRTNMVSRLGNKGWKRAYSVASLLGLVVLVYGYGLARQSPILLWSPPLWARYIAIALTVLAFILLAAAFVPGNRIKAAVGHPMVLGVKTWAAAHLIANGTLAAVVLFGAFLLWAVFSFSAARRRDRAAGTVYVRGPQSRTVVAIVAGMVAWAVFAFWLHGPLIGVRPLG